MSDAAKPATTTQTKPNPVAPPQKWRRELGVSNAEHAAAIVTGSFTPGERVTLAQYRAALDTYLKGAA